MIIKILSTVFQLTGAELMIINYWLPFSIKKKIEQLLREEDYSESFKTDIPNKKQEILLGRCAFIFIFLGYIIALIPDQYIIKDYSPLIISFIISCVITFSIYYLSKHFNVQK